MIKRNLIIILMVVACMQAQAQSLKTVGSKLNEATVFFKGAELTHTATSQLVKGVNEVLIEGLSPNIDLNSLRIKASNDVVITSFEFSRDYLTSAKASDPAIKQMFDSIKIYEVQLEKLNIDTRINSEMQDYLQTGITKNVSGSELGLGIAELVKTMDYFKSKSDELYTSQTALNKKQSDIESSLQRLRNQYNQESTKGTKTSGVLKMNLSAPLAANCTFSIIYYTPSAGWVPYYDINIKSENQPIAIAAKSKVSQTTGLDWEKVKLTLSTATPSKGTSAPLFSKWLLEERKYTTRSSFSRAMVQNSYSYAAMEEASPLYDQASGVSIRGTASEKKSQDPLYIINGVPATKAGMESLDQSSIKNIDVLKDAAATSIYGSAASNGVIVITTKSSVEDYITESDNVMSVVYDIDLPYSIPGNGKTQNIDLQSKETNAEYKYYCAPKLNSETYLLAEISDWGKLGLLSGKANITYDGTYVGETVIDASSTHEKLALTLGNDKRVSVKREKQKDFSSTKFMGGDILNTITYKLTVKNNQNRTVKMVLKDQYPISTKHNIVVTLLKETTQWTANKEDVGVITWEEELAPGETKTYLISYSVKYPKNMRLNM